jgi:hypothetical protein
MKNLFSVNKAADLLERDRQTLVRALRHVKPDGYERGHPRYTLKTITDALALQQGRDKGGADDGIGRDLQPMFDELDQRYRAVQNAPTLAERRQQARVFFSFVVEVEGAMYSDAKRRGENLRMAELRIAEHIRLNVLTLRDALDWNSDEAWVEFMKADRRVCDGAA